MQRDVFSTTDAKGIILSGNDVFVRVSGFSADELYGQPHNIIRHPDMPRAAFALLWANLKKEQPFAAYVKNMAKDGSYYWVFMVAVPTGDNQFLSIRFKPSSPLLAQARVIGNGVGVVATFLSDYARQLSRATTELKEHIAAIAKGTETINARVAMA